MKVFDIFFSKTFHFYFIWVSWLERKFIPIFQYIYFVRVKINSKRGIFILAGAMLKVVCILKKKLFLVAIEIQVKYFYKCIARANMELSKLPPHCHHNCFANAFRKFCLDSHNNCLCNFSISLCR